MLKLIWLFTMESVLVRNTHTHTHTNTHIHIYVYILTTYSLLDRCKIPTHADMLRYGLPTDESLRILRYQSRRLLHNINSHISRKCREIRCACVDWNKFLAIRNLIVGILQYWCSHLPKSDLSIVHILRTCSLFHEPGEPNKYQFKYPQDAPVIIWASGL